jgi:hypothetical protein
MQTVVGRFIGNAVVNKIVNCKDFEIRNSVFINSPLEICPRSNVRLKNNLHVWEHGAASSVERLKGVVGLALGEHAAQRFELGDVIVQVGMGARLVSTRTAVVRNR